MPFENSPNPALLYGSDQHLEALASLEYVISYRKGMALLTADIGCGKTTITQALIERLSDSTKLIHSRHEIESPKELLRKICRTLQLPVSHEDDQSEMMERIENALYVAAENDELVVLIVDEAQLLSDRVLQTIRVLLNLEKPGMRPLQVILVGQPELVPRIQDENLLALRQRIAIHCNLHYMDKRETANYVSTRIRLASAKQPPVPNFSDDAIHQLYNQSRGVPRLINTLADAGLVAAYAAGKNTVDKQLMIEAIASVHPHETRSGSHKR